MTKYKRDWTKDETYTTQLNPIFHIWKNAKDEWYYVCKFQYEDNPDQTFKTRKGLMDHIKEMLAEFSEENQLLSWSYTKIDTSFTYKEDFGFGSETYKGCFQATTIENAPEYIRVGELMDDYMKSVIKIEKEKNKMTTETKKPRAKRRVVDNRVKLIAKERGETVTELMNSLLESIDKESFGSSDVCYRRLAYNLSLSCSDCWHLLEALHDYKLVKLTGIRVQRINEEENW